MHVTRVRSLAVAAVALAGVVWASAAFAVT